MKKHYSFFMNRGFAMPWVLSGLAVLGALVIFFWPELAFAQEIDSNTLDLPNSDQSKKLVFDALFDVDNGYAHSPVKTVIGCFNAVVLFVGGILGAYTIFTGLLNTASDGELMGKKWSATHLPLRTTIGAASIMPVFNGFCFAQVAVIWLAMQGAALANFTWNTFNTAGGWADTANVLSSQNKPVVKQLAISMLHSHVCGSILVATAAEVNTAGGGAGSVITDEYIDVVRLIDPSKNRPIVKYGVVNNGAAALMGGVGSALGLSQPDLYKAALCGSYGLTPYQAGADTGTFTGTLAGPNGTHILANSNMTSSLQENMDDISRAVSDAQVAAFARLQADVAEAADLYLNAVSGKNTPDLDGKMDAAVNTYLSTVSAAVEAAAAQGKDMGTFRAAIAKDGWLYAGTWYVKMVNIQTAVNGMATNYPTPIDSINPPAEGFGDRVAVALAALDKYFKVEDLNSYSKAVSTSDMKDTSILHPFQTIKGMINNLLSSIMESLVKNIASATNPFLLVQWIGDMMISLGWDILGVAAVIAMAGGLIGGGSLASALFPLATTAFVIGASLAVVIPMMPYVIWVGCVAAWIILVIEGVVGAPLWALAHMHPDADGIVGRAGQGYMLVLGLTIRPALMIVGMVFSIVAIYPFAFFLNSTFVSAFRMSQSGSNIDLIKFFAAVFLYWSLMMMLVKKAFALIHLIPDNIMQWLGTNIGAQLGASAGEMASQAGSEMGRALGAAGGAAKQAGAAASAGRKGAMANSAARKSIDESESSGSALGSIADGHFAEAGRLETEAMGANVSPEAAAEKRASAAAHRSSGDRLSAQAHGQKEQANKTRESISGSQDVLGRRQDRKDTKENLDGQKKLVEGQVESAQEGLDSARRGGPSSSGASGPAGAGPASRGDRGSNE